MVQFIVRRLLSLIPVLVLVTGFVFVLGRLLPGDPVLQLIPPEEAANITEQDLAGLRALHGLDRPIAVQYVSWVGNAVRGDLGYSMRSHRPVSVTVSERLPVTLQLAAMAMLLAVVVGIPLGIVAALWPRTVVDSAASVTALAGLSMPNIFVGTVLIFVFAYTLQWLPSDGFVPLGRSVRLSLTHMILPAITMGTAMTGSIMRMTRTSLLDVLSMNYIATARSKGLAEQTVLVKHALKNALVPVVTVIGLQIGTLLSGSFITEQIFSLPGVGRLAVSSIFSRDYPVVQGVVMLFAVSYLLVNLIVDLLYAWLNPRIRYG
jgi:peptide/nickel transport system permease protein